MLTRLPMGQGIDSISMLAKGRYQLFVNGPRYTPKFVCILTSLLTAIRVPMDIVVGTLGGLAKLFDQRYLRRNRVAEVGIDEVDTMLDDTFRQEF